MDYLGIVSRSVISFEFVISKRYGRDLCYICGFLEKYRILQEETVKCYKKRDKYMKVLRLDIYVGR